MSPYCTIASYLEKRLEQLKLGRMFGVAGNYVAPFLNSILENELSSITISGSANEMCAGFAADGYARFNGIGAVFVTYGVGSFSVLNTIAGAYAEQVPIILINGAPTTKQDSLETHEGILSAHSTSHRLVDIQMYRPITVAAERITNGVQGAFQIDSVLTALVTTKKPVYLEVVENVWRVRCPFPKGSIVSGASALMTVSEAQGAVQETMSLLRRARKAVFWAGPEINRYGLQERLVSLLDACNNATCNVSEVIGYVTSPSSKAVLSEDNKFYQGTLWLSNDEIEDLVGDDGVLIALGTWLTGIENGNESIFSEGRVFVTNNYARVASRYFPAVDLGAYIERLTNELKCFSNEDSGELSKLPLQAVKPGILYPEYPAAENTDGITFNQFFSCLSPWLTDNDIVVADVGFSLTGAFHLHIPSQDGFVAQASWLSIGHSIAAATGVKCARPGKRVIVIVGDGAFQQNCQAVSDQIALGHNTVVFIMANRLYGVEQYVVNPNPFRKPRKSYKKELLNNFYRYNVLPSWEFSNIPATFGGGVGLKASTSSELINCLEKIRMDEDSNFVVEVIVPKQDCPSALDTSMARVGDDETESPSWPPAGIF